MPPKTINVGRDWVGDKGPRPGLLSPIILSRARTNMAEILDKVYDPQRIEKKWYRHWEETGLFTARADGARPS